MEKNNFHNLWLLKFLTATTEIYLNKKNIKMLPYSSVGLSLSLVTFFNVEKN